MTSVDDFVQNFAEISCFIVQNIWKFASKQVLKPNRLLSPEKCDFQDQKVWLL